MEKRYTYDLNLVFKKSIMSKVPLAEVSFGVVTIQKLRRIALDSNLLRTLGLSEGDTLEVALNVETSEVILRKQERSLSDSSPNKDRV